MILRERPSGIKLFLALRGSIVPRILPALIVNVAIATIIEIDLRAALGDTDLPPPLLPLNYRLT